MLSSFCHLRIVIFDIGCRWIWDDSLLLPGSARSFLIPSSMLVQVAFGCCCDCWNQGRHCVFHPIPLVIFDCICGASCSLLMGVVSGLLIVAACCGLPTCIRSPPLFITFSISEAYLDSSAGATLLLRLSTFTVLLLQELSLLWRTRFMTSCFLMISLLGLAQ